uniref:Uncharacterized protein n=1 Tax=Rhizophora mucronata TaxID=61149 RepID=A0A2P2KQ39_RHIMU
MWMCCNPFSGNKNFFYPVYLKIKKKQIKCQML